MQLSGLTQVLRASAAYRDILSRLTHQTTARSIIRAARPFTLGALAQDWHAPILYITARGKRAHNTAEQLPVWLGNARPILRYADPTPMFYDRLTWDNGVIQSRLEVLAALLNDPSPSPSPLRKEGNLTPSLEPLSQGASGMGRELDNISSPLLLLERGSGGEVNPIIITSARALMQRTLPVNLFRKHTQTLKIGERHDMHKLAQAWLDIGYTPVSLVMEPGTFSRRGGILDIYPTAADAPVRVEFFGDEIDTLRAFDPNTQRTQTTLKQVTIRPAREALPLLMPQIARHLEPWFVTLRQTAQDEIMTVTGDSESLSQGQAFSALEFYLPYAYSQPATLLDYLPEDALVVLDDPDELHEVLNEIAEEAENNRANNLKTRQLPPDYPAPYLDAATLEADLSTRRALHLNNTGMITLPHNENDAPDDRAWHAMPLQPDSNEDSAVGTRYSAPASNEHIPATLPLSTLERGSGGEVNEVNRLFAPGGRFGGQLRPVLNYARERRHQGDSIVIVTGQVERLADLWVQQEGGFLPRAEIVTEAPAPGTVAVLDGTLGEGWSLHTESGALHLMTDAEIFNWSRPEPRRRPTSKTGRRRADSNYADWQPGDYVVHVDYGIGRFKGLQTRTVEGTEREYLLIEYDGTDSLYVPIHQSDRLTRYVGADDVPPQVNKLGKPAEWLKAKERARKAAEEEARELLTIYAKRAATAGHAFQPDTPWQHELEASFPYIETEDQLKTLREVKADMENPIPMDRLVCGDVGYGKTEVALRAAFKAVMDGRQVAILAPTTVLADQHYQTFRRRMDVFPLKVELLSRFRTKAEQTQVLKQLNNGEVDIIIGTHRLLSDDVLMKNPGLVIIDEEQRFGVKHKEHFKKMRANVDVLTLTATPIPRTLYMSISGVRDISMIQTPPEDRVPVITHVGAYDPRLARQAILRELERGGQVFIIHNRVKTIEQVRDRFAELVPEASIIIGHGQMSGRHLEHVISEFGQGNYDILLATSIIENGIDMPNVNTLIVDRAEMFGMAQLYQIRGRVGRGAAQAYCYFFHAGKLTDEARARLETLAEHTDLGAGFQIAVRDLELRGAGDILSTRQTGQIATVGLQLYTQLLQNAVKELKQEMDGVSQPATQEAKPSFLREGVILDLPIAAYIPTDWIPEMALRLNLYQRIGMLQTREEVDVLAEELRDRFGVLPLAVEGLLYQIQVKLLANAINATAVLKPRQHILIKLPWLAGVDRDAMARLLGKDVEVSRTAVELLPTPETWRARLVEIMLQIRTSLQEHREQIGM